MSNNSKRHHYIPRYFINGFFNNQYPIWCYDKVEDKIFRIRSSKSIFFENNLNNIELDGEDNDILEKLVYKYLEDSLVIDIKKAQNSTLQEIEKSSCIASILSMMTYLFFRVPSLKNISSQITERNIAKQLPSPFEEVLNKLKCNPSLNIESKIKIISSLSPFFNYIAENLKPLEGIISYKVFNRETAYFLLSDNPIIFSKMPDSFNKISDVPSVFPLNYNRIFICSNNKQLCVNEEVDKGINTLLILQAKRYVTSQNKDFLQMCIKSFKILKDKPFIENVIAYKLFNQINKNAAI